MQFVTIYGHTLYVALQDIIAVENIEAKRQMTLYLEHGHVVLVTNERLASVIEYIFGR